MHLWSRDDSSTPDNEVYRRSLGGTELGYYWESVFAGTSDIPWHAVLKVKNGRGREIFGRENVTRTWLHIKQRYPLLGCRLEECEDMESVEIVIEEKDLRQLHQDELIVKDISSAQDAEDFLETILNGPRLLRSDAISRIWILSRSDTSDHFHVFVLLPHLIADGIATVNMQRTFLDALCSQSLEPLPSLYDRLSMVVAMEDLYPILPLSKPCIRWRRAIARVIYDIRKNKLQGGHTLPGKTTHCTLNKPALSRHTMSQMPVDVSQRIIANCRKANITFGNAFPVLSQVAHARILHRLRQKGEINAHDWEHRKRQPMHFAGPMNLRPYLDPKWRKAGGLAEFNLSLSFFFNTLPFMPTCELGEDQWENDMPSFPQLLSMDRFLHRSRIIKKQNIEFMNHPLFLELSLLQIPARIERLKIPAIRWRKEQLRKGALEVASTSPEPDPVSLISGSVFTNWGASLGNIDDIFPLDYPSHSKSIDPKTARENVLHIVQSDNHCRCPPSELYLGTRMSRGQVRFWAYWDGNVYEDKLVTEWFNEVRNATEWYLGREEVHAVPKSKL